MADNLFPCAGIRFNESCFKVVNSVVTEASEVGTTFTTVKADYCGSVLFDTTYFKVVKKVLTSVNSSESTILYQVVAPCGGLMLDNLYFWHDVDGNLCFAEAPIIDMFIDATSEFGTEDNFTKITISEGFVQSVPSFYDGTYSYVYKTADTVDEPTYNEDLSLWTAWDGIEEIESLADNEIYIAEVDENGLCKCFAFAEVNSPKTIEVASVAGTLSGDTAITVTPAIASGRTYVYKTGETVELPEYDYEMAGDETWTAWNGTDDITATTGDEIAIAEVGVYGFVKASAKTTVVSLA